ncbi:hypothetical protein [Paenibacillus tarimensis]|uniref:hypothetical protein n=1 Tax=Paenibacillus tarimensis TaxID=416012 RepID=UPI001F259EA5|nr:hypothetical protein [Paenibacillus tarimensis]MCF2942397.1 hypothetical protein [Paenibacillus tarimensis]
MQVHIINHSLTVGTIQIVDVSSSSLVQVGDTDRISLYSYSDSPADSLVRLPLAPLGAPDPLDEQLDPPDTSMSFWESMNEWEAGNADTLEMLHEQFWAEALHNLQEDNN